MKLTAIAAVIGMFTAAVIASSAEMRLIFDASIGEVPVSVAFDKTGNLWVSLSPICEVRRYTAWQETLRLKLVEDCTGGAGASGLAVDATGTLYAGVLGPEAVRGVYVVEPWGEKRRLRGTEQILFPNSLAFDHNNGTLYVTDMEGGAIWRIPPGGAAELWISGPLFEGIALFGPKLGANGLAIYQGNVMTSVCFPARMLRVPIMPNGGAGQPELLADTTSLNAAGVFAIDDIALDVFGNVYAASIAPPGVARISVSGQVTQAASPADVMGTAVTTLAFGSGRQGRKELFLGLNPVYGGTVSGVVEIQAGVPGRPLP